MIESDLLRFTRKVTKEGSCWMWSGSVSAKGYGRFHYERRNDYAHRVAFEHYCGPIPQDTELDHLCRNRACVNPEHLEAVAHKLNVLRGTSAKRRATDTHCNYGHPLEGENLYVRPTGTRVCRTCVKRHAQTRREKVAA